ncbi:hypothetical protein TNCV_5127571 [Trichonephila clavipes]|nr:hypothetical protein TNCV_5127571 [Trichonephila clavipes]
MFGHCCRFVRWWTNCTFRIQAELRHSNKKPGAMCTIGKKRRIGYGIAKKFNHNQMSVHHTHIPKTFTRGFSQNFARFKWEHKTFGDVLSGDFGQALPVIPLALLLLARLTRLNQSLVWRSVEILRLILSTRVQLQVDQKKRVFSNQLLDIGNSEVELHPNT